MKFLRNATIQDLMQADSSLMAGPAGLPVCRDSRALAGPAAMGLRGIVGLYEVGPGDSGDGMVGVEFDSETALSVAAWINADLLVPVGMMWRAMVLLGAGQERKRRGFPEDAR